MSVNKQTPTLRMPRLVVQGALSEGIVAGLLDGAKKVVLFTDASIRSAGLCEPILELLDRCGAESAVFDDLATEPTVQQADAIIKRFRRENADLIIGVGGGSVLDVAKLASVLDTDDYTIFDLLDDPAQARKRVRTVMIPTTAGTGSEATPNSIVAVPEKQLKIGIVNAEMIADAVVLDASMLRTLPGRIVASTGVDALAHAIECYTSKKATPFSDAFAKEALPLIFANLEKAYDEPENMQAKQNMLLAAFYAGVAIACSGTTAVHGLAYPLGGKYHIAHGVSNAMLLAPVMRYNEPSIQARLAEVYDLLEPQNPCLIEEKSRRVIARIETLVRHMEIPTSLTAFHVGREALDELVTLGLQVKRLLDNNMREITPEAARSLYLEILSE